MNRKQKKILVRIVLTAVLVVVLGALPLQGLPRLALYLLAYLVIGYDILRKAGRGIWNRQVFDENFLMAVATIGAFVLAIYTRSGDYTEAIAVMLFYQVGELFQSYAVGKSRKNISALMDIRPDYANLEKDGQLEQVDPEEVAVGSIIVVQPGEKVPLDGEVVEGSSTLDTSALTGESLPREIRPGEEIVSGCINMTGVLKVRTTKEAGESTVSKISGSGGERQLSEVPLGGLHLQIRKSLHPCRLLCGAGAGGPAAAGPAAFGRVPGLERLDLPGADLPGDQLPLRAGDQHPAELFRGPRRGQQGGRADQGLQLSGDALAGPVCGL